MLCFFLILSVVPFSVFTEETKSQNKKPKDSGLSEQLDSIKKLAPTDVAQGFEEKAAESVEKAFSLELYDSPYWKTLLHYKRSAFHKNKSLIDDPDFFLAKNGKTNSKSELEATINAFFSPAPEKGFRHAIERFPARYRWICEKLGLKDEDFPYQNGDAYYQSVVRNVNPGDVYLIFPAGYLKNPASVFGHTFLLVESKGQSRLLANSINYGAVTGLTSGPLFAILGLVGGFKGYFGFMPYYDKIKQYSNKLGKIGERKFDAPKNPKDSHGSKKLAMEGGKDVEGGYAGLQFRLTAHEQLENPAGYASNSELSFFQVDARFYPEKGEARLKKALLASVISLPVSDLYSFNPAMQIVVGLDSNTNEDLDDELALRFKGLVGASLLPASWIQPYALFGVDAFFAPRYEYYSDVLLGGETGFITTFGPWKNKMSAGAMQSPFEKNHLRAIFSAEECVTIAQNAALKGSYSLNHDWKKWWQEFSVSFNMYF